MLELELERGQGQDLPVPVLSQSGHHVWLRRVPASLPEPPERLAFSPEPAGTPARLLETGRNSGMTEPERGRDSVQE